MSSDPAPAPVSIREVALPTGARVGFGIVGTGMIAGFHAKAIAGLSGARLVGVCGRSSGPLVAFASVQGPVFATTRLEELVTHPEVQIVCVTTPSGAHLEPALAAAAAGKHVVVEKPLEITRARATVLIEACEKKGVRLVPIFQARFGEHARRVKAAIERGRLGRLVLASVQVKWHRPASYYSGWKGTLSLDGGGALINQAIHGLDLLQWFAGLPAEVFAWKARRVHTGIEAEDTLCGSLRFPCGALGAIEATTAAWPGWARRVELCGETGSILLEDDRIVRWDCASIEAGDEILRGGASTLSQGSGASAPNSISTEGHRSQLQDLVDAIRLGRPALIDGREGLKAVALVEALYSSANSGRPMPVLL